MRESQKFRFSGLVALYLSILLSACGSGKAKMESVDPKKKVSFLLLWDNTFNTYIKCSPGKDGIECDQNSRDSIPHFSQMFSVANVDSWAGLDIFYEQDGCYNNYVGPNNNGDNEEKNKRWVKFFPNEQCRMVLRWFNESNKLISEFAPTDNTSTHYFLSQQPFLGKYRLAVRNVNGGNCEMPYKVSESPSVTSEELMFPLNEVDIPFTSMFSLHWDTQHHQQDQIVPKGTFEYFHTPAIDIKPFKDAGWTTEDVIAGLQPYMGTSLHITASDNYGHTVTCKVKDAALGSDLLDLSKMDGRVQISVSRKQLVRYPISDLAEVIIIVSVNEYTDQTDAGKIAGPLSVKIND